MFQIKALTCRLLYFIMGHWEAFSGRINVHAKFHQHFIFIRPGQISCEFVLARFVVQTLNLDLCVGPLILDRSFIQRRWKHQPPPQHLGAFCMHVYGQPIQSFHLLGIRSTFMSDLGRARSWVSTLVRFGVYASTAAFAKAT